ncbi:nmrA-like domain containing protein [Rhodotorula toruloides]|uniref:NmrA-like domain containing protein n=1 Tax=Rhodotorula toruloides TaxID=5286 RepID=A0A511KCC1_RHOTO|nr:nmrA-like domain containing protein [Rhodotorula toruloides]
MSKSLFILGTGFIGGSVLVGLLKKGEYKISALCRDEKKVDKLREMGVRPVMGELSDDEVISREAATSDIIMHVATADDLPSVKSILKGLSQRSSSRPPAIYIHTSGTGVLTTPHPEDMIFNDKDQAKFDKEIPDDAPHRNVDLTIKDAVDNKKVNAKIAIMLPPLIYGIGTGRVFLFFPSSVTFASPALPCLTLLQLDTRRPFNQISMQIPWWLQESVKNNKVVRYGPKKRWNNINIRNLVPAYLTLLSHLEQSDTIKTLYHIAETAEHEWGDVGTAMHKVLTDKGLISGGIEDKEEASQELAGVGSQSRAKSELLHQFGWKVGNEKSIIESMSDEIDLMRKLGQL